MTVTINPCPFCEATQDLAVKEFHDVLGRHCYVECWNCKARGPTHSSPELAVIIWNSRGNPDHSFQGKTCGECAWRLGKDVTIEELRSTSYCRCMSTWLRNDMNACPDWRPR